MEGDGGGSVLSPVFYALFGVRVGGGVSGVVNDPNLAGHKISYTSGAFSEQLSSAVFADPVYENRRHQLRKDLCFNLESDGSAGREP